MGYGPVHGSYNKNTRIYMGRSTNIGVCIELQPILLSANWTLVGILEPLSVIIIVVVILHFRVVTSTKNRSAKILCGCQSGEDQRIVS